MLIIDVGANHGEFSFDIAVRNPNIKVIAIEPVKELVFILHKKKTAFVNNIHIENVAIDTNRRLDYINVASHHDWGVSSLLEFDEDKLKDVYWSSREDMYFDKKEEVQVIPLSDILKKYDVSKTNHVRFIKIDAQGLDLQVLISAGEFIEYIDAGMLEVSIDKALGLYKEEKYNLYDVLCWLDKNNFNPYYLKPNDPASNEFNLYFCKKNINSKTIENELSLKGINLYDGKFYWNVPSSELRDIEKENSDYINKQIFFHSEQDNKLIRAFNNIGLNIKHIPELINCIENKELNSVIRYIKNKLITKLLS